MTDRAVLHVTSLPGGGVDRHVRDIARAPRFRHLAWHTAPAGDALEELGGKRIVALDRAAFARDPAPVAQWLRARNVCAVHAHSVGRSAQERARWSCRTLGVPLVVTLHDVLFLREDGFEPGAARGPDPRWLGQCAAFLREASAVLAPSGYLAELAREHLPGQEVSVVPNGSAQPASGATPRAPRADFAARAPRHVAVVLGAIGPHKGSAVLEALREPLAGTGIAIVVLGYLDTQLLPGWHHDHLYVHGAWQDGEVASLLHAYAAQLALFPNRVPESFSYALSDLWAAGVPALVPAEGALEERVARHGGGWLLAPGADASAIAQALKRLFAPDGEGELARVKSHLLRADPGRVPSLEAMTRSLDALYARFGIAPEASASSAEVQDLLAKNLDGALFRQELVRLADEQGQLARALQAERDQATAFEREARGWIAKLEGDVAALNAELAREVEARRAFAAENAELRVHRAALERLPRLLRRLLLKRARDARS